MTVAAVMNGVKEKEDTGMNEVREIGSTRGACLLPLVWLLVSLQAMSVSVAVAGAVAVAVPEPRLLGVEWVVMLFVGGGGMRIDECR